MMEVEILFEMVLIAENSLGEACQRLKLGEFERNSIMMLFQSKEIHSIRSKYSKLMYNSLRSLGIMDAHANERVGTSCVGFEDWLLGISEKERHVKLVTTRKVVGLARNSLKASKEWTSR